MLHRVGLAILAITVVFSGLSCGVDDPCAKVTCSSQNVTGSVCVAGACQGSCAAGFADCNQNLQDDGCEVALDTDVKSCGGCGKACSTNHISTPGCTGGLCSGACDPGWSDCNHDKLTDGCEAKSDDSIQNCGGCGKACSSNHISTPSCTAGLCSGACDTGFLDCNNNKLDDGCETDPSADIRNCGGCGKLCSVSHVTPACAAGVCSGACDLGYADCNSNKLTDGCETVTMSDANNCGGCNNKCSAANITTPTCTLGACSGACNAGFADCNNNKLSDGCETATATDANNCGGCNTRCSSTNIASPSCAAGVCTGACNVGFADCNGNKLTDGCETGITADANNCGGCNSKCSSANIASPSCAAGVCTGACNAGFADCNGNKLTDGCETSITADVNNCGGCNNKCSGANIGTPSCAAGVCTGACSAGFADCNGNKLTDGCEINLNTDANNCGGCAKKCSGTNIAAPTCGSGVCNGACNAGFADCNSDKLTDGCEISLNTDVNNCGGCGKKCSSANVAVSCGSGVCNGACNAGFADCNSNKQTDGCETPVTADNNNCGMCGAICSGGNVCISGACKAAISCADIHTRYPALPSGAYQIQPAGAAAAFAVYCDMTTSGGGWTLALKANGNNTTFQYSAALWTDTNVLNAASTVLDTTDAKFQSFFTVPFSSVMVGMNVGGTIKYATLALSSTSLRTLFSGGYVGTSIGRNGWKGLISGSTLQTNCNTEGVNVGPLGFTSYLRLGIITNQEADCNTPDSFIGIGTNLWLGGPTAGDLVACCNDEAGQPATISIPATGYLFVK